MKKLLLSAAALCCFVSAHVQAQWTVAGNNTYLHPTTTSHNVIIGTSIPNANADSRLEVYSNADADVKLRLTSTYPARNFWIPFGHPNSYKTAILAQSKNNWYRYNMLFCVNTAANESSATAADSKLMINGFTGNIGIGTIEPKTLLHVQGTAANKPYLRLANSDNAVSYVGEVGGIIIGRHYDAFDGAKIYGYADWATNAYQGTDLRFATTLANTSGPVDRMVITSTGNVVIGTPTPTGGQGDYKFSVWGRARANEIVVNTDGADFVFADNYRLRPLREVEQFITTNKHLPEIPSAREMQQNGMAVGELQTKLLQKVEELTLYVIEQQKQLQELKQANEGLKLVIEAKKSNNN